MDTVDSAWLYLAIGAGCLWHGLQIVWVAPRPSQLIGDKPALEPGSRAAFQRFWLDQYAWLGVALATVGIGFVVRGIA